ncbi:MAG TPA: glycosyltransferase [Leptolyngbyaceae cyanobacterium M33_DOE_097]|uniref:Glycosyltransferase n=1 Tax=Oscillatoriales cyanobacterium SpSt-418 TaxID=2282169 RepID=A0A7C3PGY4_9CYAN|nr:glycosyltransferase [Leptolyngbyaceae cyanobacterium M33_DOE_097]
MKLFLIASECPPVPGGIATYVGNTAAMFADAGHDITVFARSHQPSIERQGHCTWIKIAPRDVHLLSRTRSHPRSETHPAFPYNVMGYWGALSYQLAETVIAHIREHGKPDAIESEDFSGLAYFLIQQKLIGCPELEGVPIILTLHSSQYMLYPASQMPSYRLSDYWVGRMEKFCTLAADGLAAPTQCIADQAIAALGTDLDIEIIPLPATKQLLDSQPLPQAEPQPSDIVYFGRLEVRKGIVPLVEACSRLWDAGVEFCLTAIGGDTWYHLQGCSMKAYLQQKYHRYIETGQLILSPPLSQPQLYERIAKAWCVVIPSLWENFPNTCMESMLLGKLILASSGVGHVEMLQAEKDAGILFDWQIPGDFERQLKHVLSLPSKEILKIGQQAQKAVLTTSNHTQVLSQRLEHLEKVIQCHRKRTFFPSLNYPPHGQVPHPQILSNDSSVSGKVSVCIPFYNHGQFIEETLESVFASDYPVMEVILLNDGSTDSQSLTKLADIQHQYPSLKVIHSHNQGVAAARNHMAAIASGEYLAFLDADDRISPHFYTYAVHVLNQYSNVGFVASWLKEFGSSQKVWIAWNPEFPYLLCHNMLGVCTVVRKSAYQATGGMKSALAENLEDHECWISLCEQGWAGVVIPAFHYFYRIRPTSRLGNSNREQLLYLYEAIARLHPDLYRKYSSEIYHLLNQNGASWLWDNPSYNSTVSTTDLTGMEILTLAANKLRRMRSDGGIALIIRKFLLLAASGFHRWRR